MNAEIEISKSQICEIEVTGLELANEAYSEEISAEPGEFTFLDTYVINALYKVDANEEKVLKDVIISQHVQETIGEDVYNVPDSAKFQLDVDGEYQVVHLIIPTKDWVDKYIAAFEEDPTEIYSEVYVCDGINVYSYSDQTYTKISLEDAFEKFDPENPIAYSTAGILETTFNMCKLDTCLFKINSKLLHEYCPAKCNKSTLSDLILKRDLLWMTKHVIIYLLEKGNFQEAQRVIEQFQGCNDFCNDNSNEGGSSCGCSARH